MSDRADKSEPKTEAERAALLRQTRSAEALRANLRRRKAQAKGRKALDLDETGVGAADQGADTPSGHTD
jgi:hypothetical protein